MAVRCNHGSTTTKHRGMYQLPRANAVMVRLEDPEGLGREPQLVLIAKEPIEVNMEILWDYG